MISIYELRKYRMFIVIAEYLQKIVTGTCTLRVWREIYFIKSKVFMKKQIM